MNGSTEPWVALVGGGESYTLVFTGLADGDHWFVRSAMYPGVCAAFAFEQTSVIPAGATRYGHHRIFVVDGQLDRSGVSGLLAVPR